MEKIRLLISENLQNLEVDLSNRLTEMGFEVIEVVSSNTDLLRVLETKRADLVLMDTMDNGLEVASQIVSKYLCPVVFLSSDENWKNVSQIDASDAISLISKPASNTELYANIRLAYQVFNSIKQSPKKAAAPKSNYIFVRADYKLNKIRMTDIFYAEAKKDYVTIHTSDNVFTTHSTMKEVMSVLPANQFLRVHRSYIVNIDKIFSIKYPDIIIESKMKMIPIGGLYRKELFAKINVLQ